jgi:cobalt/nickel transport system ATP-binding protein
LRYQGRPYRYDSGFLAALRQRVGLVFQDPDTQLFAGNVFDDVVFGPMNLGLTEKEAVRRAEAALDAVGMLAQRESPVHFLSQGQKKRVAIAGVLAMDPEALVMDEPTAGLDYPGLTSLKETLRLLHGRRKDAGGGDPRCRLGVGRGPISCMFWRRQDGRRRPAADILARPDHAALGFARPCLRSYPRFGRGGGISEGAAPARAPSCGAAEKEIAVAARSAALFVLAVENLAILG